jgi:transcriptional regulator with XRE-family HTH domain
MDEWREQLTELRRRRKLTRDELSEMTGISPESIRSYERGRRNPRRQTLNTLLAALRAPRAEANRIRRGFGYASE